ncbi:MAG: metallophosphoesterase [Nitrospirota bacterium]|nr:metallophosphoesterase [Nitrospirota bacterium]
MTLFVITFFSIYGGMHLYAFLRARAALGFGPVIGTAVALFMVAMTVVPFLIRGLERAEYELSARVLSYVGYIWLAAIFLFFIFSLAFDLYNLILRGTSLFAGDQLARFLIAPHLSFLICTGLSLFICLYGYFEAQNIRTERLTLITDKLPAGIDRLTIAQITDVHLGLIIRCDRLVSILEVVNAAKPDILVATGDIVDAQINHLPGLRELLQDIKPRYGKYAITGNHEYYAGLEKALEFITHAGFTMLRGESRDLGVIQIAGVDDRTALQVHAQRPVSDSEALKRTDRKKNFVLFLKHQPHPDPDAIGLFDLMLSGHTHKGQIWPFRYIAGRVHPFLAGKYDAGKGSIVYTSRGTGTWGPPIRFLSPPEVTVIELVRNRS